MKKKNFI